MQMNSVYNTAIIDQPLLALLLPTAHGGVVSDVDGCVENVGGTCKLRIKYKSNIYINDFMISYCCNSCSRKF